MRYLTTIGSVFTYLFFTVPSKAFAVWTPMLAASDFDGIRTDVLTMAGGIVSVVLIVVGLAMLVRAMGR